MKVKVDADICIGCSLCKNICPEVYKMKRGKAVIVESEIPEKLEGSCMKALNECPVAAIIED